jgi:hypothetical protein
LDAEGGCQWALNEFLTGMKKAFGWGGGNVKGMVEVEGISREIPN